MTESPSPKNKHLKRILLPILIGLGVVGFLLYREFDSSLFSLVNFTWYTVFWFFVAFFMLIIRDLGYMVRLKILTGGDLTWWQCLRVIMLWEFSSAVTPSAIGGTGVAIFYVTKEGISVGRSAAIVMLTSFLDELYFIIMLPLLIILVGGVKLFSVGITGEGEILSLTNEFFYFAVVGYSIKLFVVLLMGYGLFRNPRGIKWLLLFIFKLRFLRKWRTKVNDMGDDLIFASHEFRNKPVMFWLKTFGATFFSWTARYWLVNFLILAFFMVDEHFLIFARQLVMWIMMLVSPTPGGSGFAEFVFSRYLGEFVPVGFAVMMALIWRLVSYYPYLFIGAIIFPRWISQKFTLKRAKPGSGKNS
jgi:glycosyltransferase 2 family protein